MDRIARPKDDLFDNSVMTFGEHLEELRQCLVKAFMWLAVGLLGGLYFADSVVLYIQRPLESAIRDYQSQRDLTRLGLDVEADKNLPLLDLLRDNSLVVELVYDLPGVDADDLTIGPPPTDVDVTAATTENGTVEPGQRVAVAGSAVQVRDLLRVTPDIASLQPRLQLRQNEIGLSSLKMEEPFMVWFKAGLIVGAVFASPMIFYHLWSFVAAGLHAHERRYVYVYLPFSVLLFVSGVVLAFFLVLHYVLTFLLQFNGQLDVAIDPRLTYYVNFVLMLPLGFGIAFQMPLVMLFMQRIGLFETEMYVQSWKVAVLAIFFVSMVVTPADVTSMVALAIPLLFLYVLGILLCKFMPRGRGLGSDAYDPA